MDFTGVTYDGALAFRITEQDPDQIRAEMPVTGSMLNPFGVIHAGAMVWFADVVATACAIGDATITPDGKGFPLATNLTTILLANQRDGLLTATARIVRRGRTMATVRTEVRGADDRLLIELTSSHLYTS
ncbi:MAG: chemotaxis protein [Rhodobacteraceae bacterium]|nr:chemotaxis protein [Paracoccaceae bacterium]MAY45073.1 chemotaxis protein [Paracoccaceae bacterium]QEW22588.1 hypothetical protein LA6_004820 [Marinibacterium anthonyi]